LSLATVYIHKVHQAGKVLQVSINGNVASGLDGQKFGELKQLGLYIGCRIGQLVQLVDTGASFKLIGCS